MKLSDHEYQDLLVLHEFLNQELEDAIIADQNRRKAPPMEILAFVMRRGFFSIIPQEYWNRLADYLTGKHKRRRGEKKSSKANIQMHVNRALLARFLEDEGIRGKDKIGYMVEREQIDGRNVKASITKGNKHLDEQCKTLTGTYNRIRNTLEFAKELYAKKYIEGALRRKKKKLR